MDEPGAWHHVVNRGIAKRPLFETRADLRYFLSRLARQVRQRRIEVHAFCLMTTHYHLLVRSPSGCMSEAMRRVQGEYSRRFNRLRRRDGAMVRGRFHSRRVDTDQYLRAVVRYIDANPVKAGASSTPEDHEFGSADAYLRRRGPPWLSREFLESMACALTAATRFSAAAYRAAFDCAASSELDESWELVEARLAARATRGATQDLWEAAPDDVRSWMAWKLRLADGRRTGMPVAVPRTLVRALAQDQELRGVWRVDDGRRTWRGEQLSEIALLYDLCNASWQEIAIRTALPISRIRRLYREHQRLYCENPDYAARCDSLCGTLLPK